MNSKNDIQWLKRDASSKTPFFYPISYYLLDFLPEWLGGKPLYVSVWEGNFIKDDLELEAYLYGELEIAEYKGLDQHVKRLKQMMAQVHWRLATHGNGQEPRP